MIKKNTRLFAIAAFLIIVLIALIVLNLNSPEENIPGTYSFNGSEMSLRVSEEDKGWGYTIYIDNSAFIVQKQIPGVAGKINFASPEEAKLCGELVIEKIMGGKNPTVFKYELDSLGIRY